MLTVNITKENLEYVAEFVTQTTREVRNITIQSMHDLVYNLGQLTHMNNIHFNIPQDLKKSLITSLRLEYPGEVYEHKITVH
ncbi:hypothetical protein KZO01_17880 [Kurthia zopfii]|uniref:Uncharacterized protein n=1 Tax=Kurthia zopfii TaxID=1650 RepID=A0A2U3AAJ0_9BACL|nr:hypothetical protein [Kurthia zopfii]PWI21552.1 hypothetical protein DF281_11605 [Kurthia zopfii]TDR34980.1 hypothetical protein DFR61_13315 [Kurthia zopfii]STX09630.1 Uncharacterised protein [Kurthia zopfii]VEI08250.1 Uncharacterised protein [Kurthia zopfii]GEK31479.1 hypothetical protein KZO01_17880 [Kurthia zopfii]